MKTLAPIIEIIESGNMVGRNKPQTRVTIEPDWYLNLSNQVIGSNVRGPFRWWQREDGSQTELEIPQIQSVDWSASFDQDISEATIVIDNQAKKDPDGPDENPGGFGIPGFMWPTHADNPDAVAQWNQVANEWQNILVVNGLIRVYQGYGGFETDGITPLPIADAVAAQNITLKRVLVIDKVVGGTSGQITLNCRDIGRLLLDQVVYPPVVPLSLYPLQYYVAGSSPFITEFGPQSTTSERLYGVTNVQMTYSDSSSDERSGAPGANLPISGHYPTDAVDGNDATFAISDGWDVTTGTVWWDFNAPSSAINQVIVNPWRGPYQCYLSIQENGSWQPGGGAVPGTDGLPYVFQFWLNSELPYTVPLDRVYKADRIRITLTSLYQSPFGPEFYRAGLREVSVGYETTSTTGEALFPHAFGLGRSQLSGFWVVDSSGEVYGFGGATTYNENPSSTTRSQQQYGIDESIKVLSSSSGHGYYVLNRNGVVRAYGDAVWQGDNVSGSSHILVTKGAMDMAVTHTGQGYWIFHSNGAVYNFGDAPSFNADPTQDLCPKTQGVINMEALGVFAANAMTVTAAVAHPSAYGWWAINGNGEIAGTRGAATDFGNISNRAGLQNLEWCTAIECTPSGNGYWIMSGTAIVANFGDAVALPSAVLDASAPPTSNVFTPFQVLAWDMVRNPTGSGYYILRADGYIQSINTPDEGGLGQIQQENYPADFTDLSEIIKDLVLWGGWLLYEPHPAGDPNVFGVIETTGIATLDNITSDTFDKQTLMDCINTLSQVVGYKGWIDDDGGFIWRCVDPETEIYTQHGWLQYTELVVGDLVLSYNPETKQSEWQPVEKINTYELTNEKMVSIESRNHSSLTTLNHRWWVELPKSPGRWRTSDSFKRDDKIPVAAPNADLPTEPIYSDEFVELVAWWLSEGSYQGLAAEISQSQHANPENCKRIEKAIRTLYGDDPGPMRRGHWVSDEKIDEVLAYYHAGHNYTNTAKHFGMDRHTVSFWVKKRPPKHHRWNYYERLRRDVPDMKGTPGTIMSYWHMDRFICEEIHKVAPGRAPTLEFLMSLTQKQIELFVDIAILGDGNAYNVGKWGPYTRFTQKDQSQVESFENACILAGYCPSIRIKEGCPVITPGKRRFVSPVGASKVPGCPADLTYQEYTGTVWCPSVAKNETWLARRNGKIYYTGNSPNIWQPGNYLADGTHTPFVHEVKETNLITDYTVTLDSDPLVSQIIISTDTVDPNDPTVTQYTNYVPQTSTQLRGINKPAMWVNALFSDSTERETMAELIGIQIWFAQRTGSVTCIADSNIQLGDQVRITERTTSETYIHHVRGIQFSHDLDSGAFTMTLTTNWLGDGTNWALTVDDVPSDDSFEQYRVTTAYAQSLLTPPAPPVPVTPPPDPVPAPTPTTGQIFFDDFLGDTLNTTDYWGVHNNDSYGDTNGTKHETRSENVTVSNGTLKLTAKRESYMGKEFTTGVIGTRDHSPPVLFPAFGRYEAKMKTPHGQGLWPSFWMRHANGAAIAECDVMEYFHSENPGKNQVTVFLDNHGARNKTVSAPNAKTGNRITFFETPSQTPGWHTFAVAIELTGGTPDAPTEVTFSFYLDDSPSPYHTYIERQYFDWVNATGDRDHVWDIIFDLYVDGNFVGAPDGVLGYLDQEDQCAAGGSVGSGGLSCNLPANIMRIGYPPASALRTGQGAKFGDGIDFEIDFVEVLSI